MAKAYHPDKNLGDKTATAKFQDIQEAWSVLSDADLKSSYDSKRASSNENSNQHSWHEEEEYDDPNDDDDAMSDEDQDDRKKSRRSAGSNTGPKASKTPRPRPAEHDINAAKNATFSSYFYDDFTEKTYLVKLREAACQAQYLWRKAENARSMANNYMKWGRGNKEEVNRVTEYAIRMQRQKWAFEERRKVHSTRAAELKRQRRADIEAAKAYDARYGAY